MTTATALSITITVNNQKIVLHSGDPTNLSPSQMVFSLTQPTPIGTPKDFVQWLNNEFSTSVQIPDKLPGGDTSPGGVLATLQNVYSSFINGEVVLETLIFDAPNHTYQFGISYELGGSSGVSLDLFTLNSIGILISKSPDKLAKDMDVSTTTLDVQSNQGNNFKSKPKIQIDSEKMQVTAINSDTLTVTRGVDSTTKATHQAGANILPVK